MLAARVSNWLEIMMMVLCLNYSVYNWPYQYKISDSIYKLDWTDWWWRGESCKTKYFVPQHIWESTCHCSCLANFWYFWKSEIIKVLSQILWRLWYILLSSEATFLISSRWMRKWRIFLWNNILNKNVWLPQTYKQYFETQQNRVTPSPSL